MKKNNAEAFEDVQLDNVIIIQLDNFCSILNLSLLVFLANSLCSWRLVFLPQRIQSFAAKCVKKNNAKAFEDVQLGNLVM